MPGLTAAVKPERPRGSNCTLTPRVFIPPKKLCSPTHQRCRADADGRTAGLASAGFSPVLGAFAPPPFQQRQADLPGTGAPCAIRAAPGQSGGGFGGPAGTPSLLTHPQIRSRRAKQSGRRGPTSPRFPMQHPDIYSPTLRRAAAWILKKRARRYATDNSLASRRLFGSFHAYANGACPYTRI